MGIIGCEWGGGCEWEVVVGVAGAVLRLDERLLPARWQFVEDEGEFFSGRFFMGKSFFLAPTEEELHSKSM